MRAAVVIFPGTNADVEMVHTLRDLCGLSTSCVWHKDSDLPGQTDLVAIPGGFSYGDYLRAGALARAGRIVPAIRRHAERGGLVLGVCNGFQVLTETRLLPGALVRNQQLRFECRDVHVRIENQGPFSWQLQGVFRLPIAHAEGRFHAPPDTISRLEAEKSIAFRYCKGDGQLSADANPNGSVGSIAGVYGGPRHNILGLMPHPERASEPYVGASDGRKLFQAVIAWHAAHGALH
jgi:phosphoribosylformylglycinamidine synthase